MFTCIPSPGRGGASIYGQQFEDEFSEDLKHVGKFKNLFNQEQIFCSISEDYLEKISNEYKFSVSHQNGAIKIETVKHIERW